jgi:hypothetical protein
MLLGLRTTGGVTARLFRSLVGAGVEEVFPDALERGTARGVLAWDGRAVRLTRPLWANEAAVLFV